MSEQSTAASGSPPQSKLCKMGCGFFGNNATGDCCSKCWGQLKAKNGEISESDKPQICQTADPISSAQEQVQKESPAPMEVDVPVSSQSPIKTSAPTKPKKKKKKKKTSYKDMMSSMLQGSGESRDIEKEKQALHKVTGGGAFSKIDRI